MTLESKLVGIYLSKRKYPYGKLIAIFVVSLCWVLSNFYWDSSFAISSQLAASPSLVFEKGEYWRLFTTTFAHANLEHLLSNTLMLFFLTYFVTSFYGFWISPVLSLLMGGLINFFVLKSYGGETTLVGISGVIYYLWGFWLTLYLFIDKRISFIRRLVKILAIFFILLVPTSYSPKTSYLAHYLGFLIGVFMALVYYPFKAKYFESFQEWKVTGVPDIEQMDQNFNFHLEEILEMEENTRKH